MFIFRKLEKTPTMKILKFKRFPEITSDKAKILKCLLNRLTTSVLISRTSTSTWTVATNPTYSRRTFQINSIPCLTSPWPISFTRITWSTDHRSAPGKVTATSQLARILIVFKVSSQATKLIKTSLALWKTSSGHTNFNVKALRKEMRHWKLTTQIWSSSTQSHAKSLKVFHFKLVISIKRSRSALLNVSILRKNCSPKIRCWLCARVK